MPDWQDSVLAATASVLVDGRPAGSAVLVDGRHLLTARHLVAQWRGTEWTQPAASVDLTFPTVDGGDARDVAVQVPSSGTADFVILDLGEQPPSWLPSPPSLWAGARLPDAVSVLGFPHGEREPVGVWRELRVSGPTARGSIQLRWAEDAGTLPGQSGGPVVHTGSGALVGLLVEGSEAGRFDRFLPVTLIERHWAGMRRPWLFAGLDAQAHVRRRALGQRGRLRGGDLFKGRSSALDAIRTWLDAEQSPGRPLVITGQPGAGKSAVLARSALAAEKARPGSGLVFHARGATDAEFVDAVARLTGVAVEGGRESLLESLASTPPEQSLTIMVDALDEAASSEERRGMARTLSELASLPSFRVVVATRPMAAGDRFAAGGLLQRLGVTSATAAALVDLDAERYDDPAALHDFAAALLCQDGAPMPGPVGCAWALYRADSALRRRLAGMVAERADRNFLVAALTAAPLATAEHIVDPAAVDFDSASLPGTVNEALERYLDSLPDQQRYQTRGLLTALAYARGAGITDKLWLRFAKALGYPAEQADLDRLRDTAAVDYLLQTSPAPREPVVRLFHQALVDQLVVGRTGDEPSIFAALVKHVRKSGGWASLGASYARRHAAEHAAAAGTLNDLLGDLQYVGHAVLDHLVAVIASLDPNSRRPAATVVLQAASRATGLSTDSRLGLFALTTAHLGLPMLRSRVGHRPVVALEPVWAHSLGSPHQQLTGHTAEVYAVALGSIGGRDVILSASDDATVRLWDEHGTPVGDPVTGHTGSVRTVAAARLGGREVIVSGGFDTTVRVWDAHGTPVGYPLTGHTGWVNAVMVSGLAGTHVIVSASDDATIRLWDQDGNPVRDPMTGHTGSVRAVASGRLGARDVIVSTGDDASVRLWDQRGNPIGDPLTGHTGSVRAVAVARLGERDVIVSAGEDATVRLWDEHGAPIGEPLTGHTGSVRAVAVARRGGRDVVVSSGNDATVRLWDEHGNSLGDPLTGHAGWVRGVAVGHLGERAVIASAGSDAEVRIWEEHSTSIGNPLNGHTGMVRAVAVGRLGGQDVIVSAGNDATVRLWDNRGNPIGDPLTGHTDWVRAVSTGRLGERDVIVSAAFDGTLRIWDEHGTQIGDPLVAGHTGWVRAVAVGRLGERDVIVSAADHQTVRVWDQHGTPVGDRLIGHIGSVRAVAVGRLGDRDVIVSAGDDMTVRVWDQRGTFVGDPLTGHTGWVNAVAVGRLGGRDVIVSAGGEGTVRVWDEHGTPIGDPLTGHTNLINGVGVGRLGGRDVIVSAGDDKTVRVWDQHCTPVGEPFPLLERGMAVALHPAGLVVASGSALVFLAPTWTPAAANHDRPR
jgi:WD40 repeat protein